MMMSQEQQQQVVADKEACGEEEQTKHAAEAEEKEKEEEQEVERPKTIEISALLFLTMNALVTIITLLSTVYGYSFTFKSIELCLVVASDLYCVVNPSNDTSCHDNLRVAGINPNATSVIHSQSCSPNRLENALWPFRPVSVLSVSMSTLLAVGGVLLPIVSLYASVFFHDAYLGYRKWSEPRFRIGWCRFETCSQFYLAYKAAVLILEEESLIANNIDIHCSTLPPTTNSRNSNLRLARYFIPGTRSYFLDSYIGTYILPVLVLSSACAIYGLVASIPIQVNVPFEATCPPILTLLALQTLPRALDAMLGVVYSQVVSVAIAGVSSYWNLRGHPCYGKQTWCEYLYREYTCQNFFDAVRMRPTPGVRYPLSEEIITELFRLYALVAASQEEGALDSQTHVDGHQDHITSSRMQVERAETYIDINALLAVSRKVVPNA